MKNIFFICMFATVAFTGCVDDDDDLLTGEVSPGVEILPENKPNEVVDSKLFEIINLDYPGLEKVKKFYENGEYYYAANELLEYYRTRVDVNNPNVNLINPTISEKDQRIADQALEHRFYVKGFAESVDEVTKLETYYSFYDASAKKIIETVKKTGSKVSGPVPLPTKKEVVTILRAVHKYKDSREQFEQRTHKRLIDILTPTQKTVDALSRLEMPAGVNIDIKMKTK